MPTPITKDEKDSFLALLRVGKDPAEAATMINPEYTASMFRRLTNEGNQNYDPIFASDYLRARAEGRQNQPPKASETGGKPRTVTLSGHVKAAYITEEMLEAFLEDIANGVPMKAAADKLDPKTSLSQIHKRALRDPEFAEAYAAAKEEGYPIFRENLRAEAIRQAMNGDYRALRDQLMIHDPDFRRILLAQKHEISGELTGETRLMIEKVFPDLAAEQIEGLIEHLQQRQIEAA